MNRLNKVWILVIGLTLIGVVFTFGDYWNYRKIETENYGHGPGEVRAVWNLEQLYQNEFAGVRIRYPAGWKEETKINKRGVFGEIVSFKGAGLTAKITVDNAAGSLKDWEDREIASLSKNEQMYGERSYENTERINMTVINFQRFVGDDTFMISRYLAKKNNNLYILEFTSKLADWPKNEAEFKAMAKTMVLL